ncbi:hypothetical protein [Marinobacter nauticus]|uniref:Uncharacterized protein n=1 Tax=Marinobacter nauticus TaxID=2743 RepID=A0A1M2UYE5_MARNT|nr:hypothetical protein [Marinobacter nauticus]OJT00349.1 hypothetical protein BEE62_09835 [Marinobacter nauticus]
MTTTFKIAMCVLLAMAVTVSAQAQDWSRDGVLSFDTRKVLGKLESALKVHDEIPTLEESRLIGRDQKSAGRELEKIIRESMELFESESINGLRTQYRRLEERIATEKDNITRFRKERVLASRDDRSLRTKLMPGDTLKSFVAVTKADFDMLIEAAENNIEGYEEEKARTITDMSNALGAIGVELSGDQLEALMSSVTGDDVVSMSVVFNAIKDMTTQLAELTQESGEDLAYAKKYYGMVVILHRIIGTMQEQFVAEIDDRYLPKLQEYRGTANSNIKESRALLAAGANAETMRSNIRSNEMTIQVINLYEKMLKGQRAKVNEALKVTEKEIRVANNTYNTVSLSSAVVSMIRQGANTFEQLISLQMPDVQEFQNEQVREEFRNLTARMGL